MFKQPDIDPVVATLGRQLEKDSFFTSDDQTMEEVNGSGRCCPGLSNLHALFVKNLLKLRRNPAMLLFVFLLPAIQVVLLSFCLNLYYSCLQSRWSSFACQSGKNQEVLPWGWSTMKQIIALVAILQGVSSVILDAESFLVILE